MLHRQLLHGTFQRTCPLVAKQFSSVFIVQRYKTIRFIAVLPAEKRVKIPKGMECRLFCYLRRHITVTLL